MNRLEKKCLLGSAAMHGLLVVVFLLGSAFLKPPPVKDLQQPLEIIPANALKFTDGPSRGGNPNAAPPPAVKPPPEFKPPAAPKVEKPAEPEKPKEIAKPKELEPKDVGDDPVPVKRKTKETAEKPLSRISTNVVKRAKVDTQALRAQKLAKEQAEADARATAAYQKSLASAADRAGQAVSQLGGRLSGNAVSVSDFGPGGGGPAVANWRAAVGDIYTRMWEPPQDAEGSAKVEARVTIARDGTVLSARPTKNSGDRPLDASVNRVLQQVRSVPAFPDGAREDQRTLTIIFDLTVKRALG
jgi:TonB family protein